jgi:predicted GNAT superfamily acetyltransferase
MPPAVQASVKTAHAPARLTLACPALAHLTLAKRAAPTGPGASGPTLGNLDYPMTTLTYRDLTSLEEFAAVVDLERTIWGPGYDDVVPVSILAISVQRGGILIGAFDEDRMIGFVYSLPGIKDRKPTQWSHMLGVVDECRKGGAGYQLKVLQRERALAMGLDLIEWTYDPMQAANAHLNFAKLGVVVEHYEENVYGESASPLHHGLPTDRFIAEWWIRMPRIEQRIGGSAPMAPVLTVEPVNRTRPQGEDEGEWLEPIDVNLTLDAKRISVEIPTGFTEMLQYAPELALEWRMTTRRIFTTYFARGYRIVEFFLDRPNRKGTYLLVKS